MGDIYNFEANNVPRPANMGILPSSLRDELLRDKEPLAADSAHKEQDETANAHMARVPVQDISSVMRFRGMLRKEGEKVRATDGKPLPRVWVYGCGVCVGNGPHSIIYGATMPAGDDADVLFENKMPVYTDTIGMFTGYRDTYGVEMFTDDIVEFTDGDYLCKAIIKFGEYNQEDLGGESDDAECVGFYYELIDHKPKDDTSQATLFRSPDQNTIRWMFRNGEKCKVVGSIFDKDLRANA